MTDNARNKIQSQNSFKWHHSQKAKMFRFAKMFGWVKKSSNMAVAPLLTWSTVLCAFLLIVLRLRILCFPSTNFTCLRVWTFAKAAVQYCHLSLLPPVPLSNTRSGKKLLVGHCFDQCTHRPVGSWERLILLPHHYFELLVFWSAKILPSGCSKLHVSQRHWILHLRLN